MKIQIAATGYYNQTIDTKVCLLREGDILQTISYDKDFDGWLCLTSENKRVLVEKENAIELNQ
jgi:hypothetical protein